MKNRPGLVDRRRFQFFPNSHEQERADNMDDRVSHKPLGKINTTAFGLYAGTDSRPLATVIPDDLWPGLYRIHFNDGAISDVCNLTRAKDAAVAITDRYGRAFRWQKYATNALGSPPISPAQNSDPENVGGS
jgi:hypothetical protein